MALKVRFFRTENGAEPVRDWLKSFSREDKRILGSDIKEVEYRWPDIRRPLIASLGDGLWEIRSSITGNRITRIIFFQYGDALILVHGFIKKTQKIPKTDLDLAKKRRKLFLDHN